MRFGPARRCAALALWLGLATFMPAYGMPGMARAAEGPAYSGAAAPLPVPPRAVPAPGIPPQIGAQAQQPAGTFMAPAASQGVAQNSGQDISSANYSQNASDLAPGRVDTPTVEKAPASSRASSSAYSWGTYFWGVGLVCFLLALLWLLLHFLRRRGLGGMGRQNLLNLEARLSMGKNQHLVVVNFAGKRLLLGVTEHNISALGEAPAENFSAGTNHA